MTRAKPLPERPKHWVRRNFLGLSIFLLIFFLGFGYFNKVVERKELAAWHEIEILAKTKWKDESVESALEGDLRKRGFTIYDSYKRKNDGIWVVSKSAGRNYRIDHFGSYATVWWSSESGIAKDIRVSIRPYAF